MPCGVLQGGLEQATSAGTLGSANRVLVRVQARDKCTIVMFDVNNGELGRGHMGKLCATSETCVFI